ncbi:MAG: LCP family protein [Oscillospiraceae bacterium]|nr:LCP family protein [Oscillospiraceae bacterium]
MKEIYSDSRGRRPAYSAASNSRDIYSNVRVKRRKRRKTLKEKLVLSMSILVIVASILSISVFAAIHGQWLDKENLPALPGGFINKSDRSKVEYILIAGIDFEEGNNVRGANQLTDTLMMLCFDRENNTMNFLQFPRDTFVGSSTQAWTGKINSIYTNGSKNGKKGIEGLNEVIAEAFDIHATKYVTVNMGGFKSIISALGGIEVDVPSNFPTIRLDGVTIRPGKQTMNGLQAEKFVRARNEYSDADYGRMRAQRIFMSALFERFFSLSKTEIARLAPSMIRYVATDLTISEILSLSDDARKVDKADIRFFSLEGRYYSYVPSGNYPNQSTLEVNKTSTMELLNTHFRPYSEKKGLDKLKIWGNNLNRSDLKNEDTAVDDPFSANKK